VAGIDLLTLELHATLLARIEAATPAEAAEPEAEDETAEAGALRLAIELDEAPAGDAAAPAA
jgi:exoribonuclease-2